MGAGRGLGSPQKFFEIFYTVDIFIFFIIDIKYFDFILL